MSGLEHDKGRHRLAPFDIRQSDHRDFADGGMQDDRVLDFLRHDGAAAGTDDVVEATDDVKIAGVVELADVSGMQPAVAQAARGLPPPASSSLP